LLDVLTIASTIILSTSMAVGIGKHYTQFSMHPLAEHINRSTSY